VGPQDVVAARVLVAGDDVAHFQALVAEGLAPGLVTQVGEALVDIILRRLEVFRPVDAALPQADAEVLKVGRPARISSVQDSALPGLRDLLVTP
jgi:hypothetical protein